MNEERINVRGSINSLGVKGKLKLPKAGWKIQCKLPPKTKRFCPLVLK